MMQTSQAAPLLDMYPLAAKYDSDNLVITGEMPGNFSGTIDDIASTNKETTELTTAIDAFRVETPSNKIVMLSYSQGHWLRENHAAFMPTPAVN